MADDWVLLQEESGKTYCIELVDENRKVKGLGIINSHQVLSQLNHGDIVEICNKNLVVVSPRLPEVIASMKRRAQTISDKDAGVLISKLGIGAGDQILEAGLGSAGLSLHLCRVLGQSGELHTAESRSEHSAVGLENLERARNLWTDFPNHVHHDSSVEDAAKNLANDGLSFDAIILDLPDHTPAVNSCAPLLKIGGRIACYCPVTSQLENSWLACEEAGLEVVWAGEIIERQWGKASKGGVRPVNGPFGHTAFLLIAQRK